MGKKENSYIPTRLDHSNSRLVNGWLDPISVISNWDGQLDGNEVERSRVVGAPGHEVTRRDGMDGASVRGNRRGVWQGRSVETWGWEQIRRGTADL